MDKHLILELLTSCNLGSSIKSISSLSGGFLHKMFKVKSETGCYAIKLLNPQIVKRDNVLNKLEVSEEISQFACNNNVNAITSIKVENKSVQRVDNNYFIVFNYYDYSTYSFERVTLDHVKKIGCMLANIHRINFSSFSNRLESKRAKICNWALLDRYYQINPNTKSKPWFIPVAKIKELNYKALESLLYLSKNQVVSHRDLDPKNVLWSNNEVPYAIDWESAGLINPALDLITVALDWSTSKTGNINKQLFLTVIDSYRENYKGYTQHDYAQSLWAVLVTRLEWLEYVLKKSLGLEINDKTEINNANNQVTRLLKSLNMYMKDLNNIIKYT